MVTEESSARRGLDRTGWTIPVIVAVIGAIGVIIAAAVPVLLSARNDEPGSGPGSSQESRSPLPSQSLLSPSLVPSGTSTIAVKPPPVPPRSHRFPDISIQSPAYGKTMYPNGQRNGGELVSLYHNAGGQGWHVEETQRVAGVAYHAVRRLRTNPAICLDLDPTDAKRDGAFVMLYACSGAASQRWSLTEDRRYPRSYRLKNLVSSMCIEFAGFEGAVERPVVQRGCSSSEQQVWLFSPRGCGADDSFGEYIALMVWYDDNCSSRVKSLSAWHWLGERLDGQFRYFVSGGNKITDSATKSWTYGERATVALDGSVRRGQRLCVEFWATSGQGWERRGTQACVTIP